MEFMAGVEWGPKSQPLVNRRLFEVTRIPGEQLTAYQADVQEYTQANPQAPRDDVVLAIAKDEKNIRRADTAIDVLNQLHIVGRSAEDVRSVVVRDDANHKVTSGEKVRNGDGNPHRYYTIDWVKEPDPLPEVKKPEPPKKQQRPQQAPSAIRRTRESNYDRERRERRDHLKREERLRAIDRTIIDPVPDMVRSQLADGFSKIEVGEDGVANLYTKKGLFTNGHVPVNRETGALEGTFESMEIKKEYMKYYEHLMKIAEGNESTYAPESLTEEQCEKAFKDAVETWLLQTEIDDDGSVTFYYLKNPNEFLGLFSGYAIMNLETGTVAAGREEEKRTRLIHPDFTAFLRKIKTEHER